MYIPKCNNERDCKNRYNREEFLERLRLLILHTKYSKVPK